MNKTIQEALRTGWNLNEKLGGDFAAMLDLIETRKLNERAVAAWTRGNNSGNPAYLAQQEKKSENCYQKAKAIADKRGWRITQPGLWWEITDANGRNITP